MFNETNLPPVGQSRHRIDCDIRTLGQAVYPLEKVSDVFDSLCEVEIRASSKDEEQFRILGDRSHHETSEIGKA